MANKYVAGAKYIALSSCRWEGEDEEMEFDGRALKAETPSEALAEAAEFARGSNASVVTLYIAVKDIVMGVAPFSVQNRSDG